MHLFGAIENLQKNSIIEYLTPKSIMKGTDFLWFIDFTYIEIKTQFLFMTNNSVSIY